MSKVHYNELREEIDEDIFLGIKFFRIIFAGLNVTRLDYKSLQKKRMGRKPNCVVILILLNLNGIDD